MAHQRHQRLRMEIAKLQDRNEFQDQRSCEQRYLNVVHVLRDSRRPAEVTYLQYVHSFV